MTKKRVPYQTRMKRRKIAIFSLLCAVPLLIVTLIVLFLVLPMFSGQSDLQRAGFVIVEAINNNETDTVEMLIFNDESSTSEDERSNLENDTKGANEENTIQESPISLIIENTQISMGEIGEDTIEYSVVSPQMQEMFTAIQSELTQEDILNLTGEALNEFVKEYIKIAPKVTTTILVDYEKVDDKYVFDYTNENFVNAITGGFLEAYSTLYNQMIDEYREWLESQE